MDYFLGSSGVHDRNQGRNARQRKNGTDIRRGAAGRHDFDDGSIWTLKTYEDGQQYLVKEVQDDNENEVIRKKVAKKNNIINKDEFDESLSKFLRKQKIVVSSKLLSDIKQLIINYALKENK